MHALIFDPFAGISGDMTVAGLLDLGLPLPWLRDFVGGLGVGPVEVEAERVERGGIACTRLLLGIPPEHVHRHLGDVLRIIERSGTLAEVRDRAAHAFTLLAEAEAEVHGTTPERVHFHEVGATDAIVDVLCAVAGCAELGLQEFYTRPVALGRGWVEIAHGNFPLPAPAALKLLRGVPVRDPDWEGECTTPTGAAVLQALTAGREPPARFVPDREGFGAGARDPHDRPNCLRLLVVDTARAAEALVLLQSDLDDLSPEYVPPLLEALLAAGALDATATPLLMKKGRPGVRIEALAGAAGMRAVSAALFEASSSIGVRHWEVAREALPRREERVWWRGHEIRVKRSRLPGGGERAKPEFEDVARAAAVLGMPPLAAYRAMIAEGIASER